MNNPLNNSLWVQCFFEVAEKARAEGKTKVNFDEVDALVLEKAKMPKEQPNLPTRLRELVQNIRDADMEIKKSGHYIHNELISRYTRRLLQIANELEKEG